MYCLVDRTCRFVCVGYKIMNEQYEKFNNIDINQPKVHKIINCAYEIFSKNNIDKASTNQIVKLAGISRGLLYHYFKDKQELYDFLTFFAIKKGVVEIKEKLDWDDSDFINRMIQVTKIRFEIMECYPYMATFFQRHKNGLNKSVMKNIYENLNPGARDKFYSYNLNFNNLKKGVDRAKMIQIVKWTVKGKLAEWNEMSYADQNEYTIDKLISECIDYLEFLRTVFYNIEKSDEQ